MFYSYVTLAHSIFKPAPQRWHK